MNPVDIFSDFSHFRASCRAIWTQPNGSEPGAPPRRIIHSRYFSFPHPVRLIRAGVKLGEGYFKCGSESLLDWPEAFRILAWQDNRWSVLREEANVPRPEGENTPIWFSLPDISVSSVIVEVRRSGLDGWWPSWNLAMHGVSLETSAITFAPIKDNLLQTDEVRVENLPGGLQGEHRGSEVRFRSDYLEVGFCLNRPGFSFLSYDATGRGRFQHNLLQLKSYMVYKDRGLVPCLAQGLILSPVEGDPLAGYFHFEGEGHVTVNENKVAYHVDFHSHQQYHLEWTVEPTRLTLKATRHGELPERAWSSSIWHTAFACDSVPTNSLGKITEEGETGLMSLPILVHSPGFGSLKVGGTHGDLLWRFDSVRPLMTTTGELKLGEVPQPEGDYLLLPGEHAAEICFDVVSPKLHLIPETPPPVREALKRCSHTSLPYRADAGTLSNNGNSIHCTFCMDGWAELSSQIGLLLPAFSASSLVEQSLSRWLNGGPSYACGGHPDGTHRFEDEYLHTPAAALLGLALHLKDSGTPEWVERHSVAIGRELKRLKERDLDGDGLIESPYRRGISGEAQWSTNWWDIISFGWKDAFVNALLYRALCILEKILPRLCQPILAESLSDWARQIKESYTDIFLNPETGWIAGWRSSDNVLHDYGFLFVNGAAVNANILDVSLAHTAMGSLWNELQGLPISFRYGIPGNLRPIAPEDMATDDSQKIPRGCYENQGLTHSQSHHFLAALYRVGMKKQADHLLEELCTSLADASAFGGCGTGVDWRRWSGIPCGYEGLLSEQFTMLAVAMERYSAKPGGKCMEGIAGDS